MSKLITILAIFLVSIISILALQVTDANDFEIDVFNTGDTVIINSEIAAAITIVGPNTSLTDDFNSSYEFVPKYKGDYEIELESEDNLESYTIFVTQGLNLDWEKLAEVNDQNSKEVLEQIEAELESLKAQNENVWARLINFIKMTLGIING